MDQSNQTQVCNFPWTQPTSDTSQISSIPTKICYRKDIRSFGTKQREVRWCMTTPVRKLDPMRPCENQNSVAESEAVDLEGSVGIK
ncbi:unnamed protein product [Arabis nemorensis]|uniref:Uncharacterized protein n=1 Tax=Arabis nemorensis TaxID=586526 RepID=A0A565ATA9_9BRAS|nr:unnamed protein product [Arabis nemorensis]